MKKILLFDIDGTLLYTGGAGRTAFERTFEELFGISGAWGRTVPDGKTDPAIISEIADRLRISLRDSDRIKIRKHYTECFRRDIGRSPRFRVMPGVKKLIRSLAQRPGMFLGLATGNFEETSWMKLKRAGLDAYFKFGGFGSDGRDRFTLTQTAVRRGRRLAGSKVPPEDIFVIGDTGHDISAGRRLGVRTIAVATGHSSLADLAKHGPHHIFPDFRDTGRFLEVIEGLAVRNFQTSAPAEHAPKKLLPLSS